MLDTSGAGSLSEAAHQVRAIGVADANKCKINRYIFHALDCMLIRAAW